MLVSPPHTPSKLWSKLWLSDLMRMQPNSIENSECHPSPILRLSSKMQPRRNNPQNLGAMSIRKLGLDLEDQAEGNFRTIQCVPLVLTGALHSLETIKKFRDLAIGSLVSNESQMRCIDLIHQVFFTFSFLFMANARSVFYRPCAVVYHM